MTLTIPTPQAEIRNLDVISTIPGLIAALVAALGFGAMAHALLLNVRRSRGTLAVLRTLGFTSGQVVRAVTAQANGLALAAVAIGVPLGIIAGDWSWSERANELGVQDSTVVPVWVAVLAAIGAFVGVNAAALWPGFRAGRADLGATLRSE
jgi:putative ABC transport system permease protein